MTYGDLFNAIAEKSNVPVHGIVFDSSEEAAILDFANDSTLKIVSSVEDFNYFNYHGHEYRFIAYGTEIPPEFCNQMKACLRGPGKRITVEI